MLLTDHAALWLQHQGYDWATITFAQIKQDLTAYFVPVDSVYQVKTALAQCKQTGAIQGYLAVFTKLAIKVPDLNEAEKLDKFLCKTAA